MIMHNKDSEIFSFIERTLFWEGRLTVKYLVESYNLTFRKAAEYIQTYKDKAENNIDSNLSVDEDFYPNCEEFDFLFSENNFNNILNTYAEKGAPFIERLPVISPFFDKDILSELIRGMHKKDRILSIRYQSLNSKIPEERKIIPYSISYIRNRYHIRAYCFKKNGFRDFVLSRIITITNNVPYTDKAIIDYESAETVSVVIKPHSKLSQMQKMCTEMEFGMENGQRVLKVRKPMLVYFLDELRIGSEYYEPPFTVLELVNKDEVESLLSS